MNSVHLFKKVPNMTSAWRDDVRGRQYLAMFLNNNQLFMTVNKDLKKNTVTLVFLTPGAIEVGIGESWKVAIEGKVSG